MSAEHLGDDMDLPYGENPELKSRMASQLDQALMSGGINVAAAYVDMPSDPGVRPLAVRKPALVFQFAAPDGRVYQPILLVLDDVQMAKLRPLIFSAIHDARQAAKES